MRPVVLRQICVKPVRSSPKSVQEQSEIRDATLVHRSLLLIWQVFRIGLRRLPKLDVAGSDPVARCL